MKSKIKRTALLVLSCASLVATIGYSSWIVQSHQEYALKNLDNTSKPVAYIVGNEKTRYTSIQKAVAIAHENGGGIVTLVPPEKANYNDNSNPQSPDSISYLLKGTLEIPADVTLIIPTDKNSLNLFSPSSKNPLESFLKSMKEDNRNNGSNGSYSAFATSNSGRYKRVTLELEKGAKIINKGHLILSGYLGGGTGGSGIVCQTSQSYSEIVLGQGAAIVQDGSSAVFDCLGYVFDKKYDKNSKTKDEKGSVEIVSGTLNAPLVVEDYQGFTYSWAMTDGAITNEGCSPFNKIGMPNIASSTKIDYGARVNGIVNIYILFTSSMINVNEVSHQTISIVGDDSSSLIQLKPGSNLVHEYDFSKFKYSLVFNGSMSLNPMNMVLTTNSPSMSVSLSTEKALFPISYQYSISCNAFPSGESGIFDFTNQSFKMMPGSSLNFAENSQVKANKIAIMTSYYCSKSYGADGKGFAGSFPYPLKDGATFVLRENAKISANALAGVVYCKSNSQINSVSDEMIIKTAWNTKSSGKTNPLWTINEYLQNTEKLNVLPLDNLGKRKIFVGSNVFSGNASYQPNFKIALSDGKNYEFDGKQGIIILDEVDSCKVEFISNIYRFYNESSLLQIDESINLSDKDIHVCAVNTNLSVSNNNNGINEFRVQSVKVSYEGGLTDDNQIPLYKDETIALKATVDDLQKSYDKQIVWSSSDENVATVDQSGNVTALQIGVPFKISATCGGVSGSIDLVGIEKQSSVEINEVWIIQGNYSSKKVAGSSSYFGGGGTKSDYNGKYSNKDSKKYKFELKMDPENGSYKSITWTFYGEGTREFIYETENSSPISGTASNKAIIKNTQTVWVSFDGDVGKTPDLVHLEVSVEQQDSSKETKTAEFLICHGNPCLLPTALVLMADGTYKQAGLLKTGEKVISFNHETGVLEPNIIIGNDDCNIPAEIYNVVHLEFSNKIFTDFIFEHGYFDITLNKYVYMHENDFLQYIGHEFIAFDSLKRKFKVKLINGVVKQIFTKLAAPATANHLNLIVDDMLSMEGGLSGLFNIFDYDPETLAFDKAKMNADIKKYGLLSYKDFERFFPKEIYDLLPCKYLGVSIGKGLITWGVFESYVNKWKDQLMENLK